MESETQWVRSGDVWIAYQVVGEGPFDLVFVPPFVTHIELIWKLASFAPSLARLASFSRLIRFDKRGTGMSDRVSGAPNLETRMDDVRAVLDAVGSKRAALYGSSEGGAMCLLFAATYPERTAALVLANAYPRTMWAPDYPWGLSEEGYRLEQHRDQSLFGARSDALHTVRSRMLVGEAEAEQWLDYFRWSGSPGAVEALALMNKEIDVRHVLPAIRVPTLVTHRSGDPVVPPEVARYMAERIAGASLVDLPGGGRLATGEAAANQTSVVERFLTGIWESGGWEEAEPDRMLATVLFTDIVGSSERAVALGDRAWGELLARYHEAVRRQLLRFRGKEVDTAGDGFFASFDGPARAIRCASAVLDSVRELGIEVRAGLHTGECELVDGKVAGIAVHIGARVASQAQSGEVLVSSTVKDLVAGSGLAFDDRGTRELKGIPGDWRLYAVTH